MKTPIFDYFSSISQQIAKKFKILFPAFFSIPIVVLYPEFQLSRSYGVTRVFLKPKMAKNDLLFHPWPLTFWPMTLTFGIPQGIPKTHHLWKFQTDTPLGRWWKAVDSLSLTAWLTASLTNKVTSMGERCHPKRTYALKLILKVQKLRRHLSYPLDEHFGNSMRKIDKNQSIT